jgi:head-tail adaptor
VRLDRRVQFYRAAMVDDGFQMVEAFAPYGESVPANRADVSTREAMEAAQVQANLSTRFTVRSSDFSRGITPKDKIACEGLYYDIQGLRQLDRKRWLEITAAARADIEVFSTSLFSGEFSAEFS